MGNKQTELNNSGNQVETVPVWVKPYLTIDEATAYTGIGRDKLYEMTSREKCPFVLWVGNRRMIKRRVLVFKSRSTGFAEKSKEILPD